MSGVDVEVRAHWCADSGMWRYVTYKSGAVLCKSAAIYADDLCALYAGRKAAGVRSERPAYIVGCTLRDGTPCILTGGDSVVATFPQQPGGEEMAERVCALLNREGVRDVA